MDIFTGKRCTIRTEATIPLSLLVHYVILPETGGLQNYRNMACSKGYLAHIYDSFKELASMDVIVAYEGYATHQVLKAFTELVEEKLEGEHENECIRRQLHHVLVECIQNINRHGEHFRLGAEDYLPGKGGLLICKSEKAFRVATSNYIERRLVEEIRSSIDSINSLSEEELYELYKKQLKEGDISPKGGAGVGLIDMRRKTANKLEYDFVDCDKDRYFFLFQVLISRIAS